MVQCNMRQLYVELPVFNIRCPISSYKMYVTKNVTQSLFPVLTASYMCSAIRDTIYLA